MALAPAIRAAIAVLRSRTDDLLPAFLLTPAVSAVARTVGLVGLAVAYAHLEVTGRLGRFRSGLADRRLDPPDPNADPDAFAEWVDGIAPLVESLITPTTIAILAASGVLALVVLVVLTAGATAAQFAACRATLDDERGTTAAIRGARAHWFPILGVQVAEFLLLVNRDEVLTRGVRASTPRSEPSGGRRLFQPQKTLFPTYRGG